MKSFVRNVGGLKKTPSEMSYCEFYKIRQNGDSVEQQQLCFLKTNALDNILGNHINSRYY